MSEAVHAKHRETVRLLSIESMTLLIGSALARSIPKGPFFEQRPIVFTAVPLPN
jgi:hypothetical protein